MKPNPRSSVHRFTEPISRSPLADVPLEEKRLSDFELVKPEVKSNDLPVDAESRPVECNWEDLVPPKLNAVDDDWFRALAPKPNLDEVESLFDEPPKNDERLEFEFVIVTSCEVRKEFVPDIYIYIYFKKW